MIALFFDTETTGFKHDDFVPEIVQIGAILQDTVTRRVLGELNVMVAAQNGIPENVAAIHGITDEMNALYGFRSGLAEMMFDGMVRMADRLVAHNISFDVGIIKDTWQVAYTHMLEKQEYCTMLNSTSLVGIPKSHGGGYKHPKLVEAYKHIFGKEFDNAHDAMADVRACRDVYFHLLEQGLAP